MGSEGIDRYAMRSYMQRQDAIDSALEVIQRCEQICRESRLSNISTILQLLYEYSEVEAKARDKVLFPVSDLLFGRSFSHPHMQIYNEINKKFQVMKEDLVNFGLRLEQASDIGILMTLGNEMVQPKRVDLAKMIIEDRRDLVKKFEDETENIVNWQSMLENLRTEWEDKKVTINEQIDQCVQLITTICNCKNRNSITAQE